MKFYYVVRWIIPTRDVTEEILRRCIYAFWREWNTDNATDVVHSHDEMCEMKRIRIADKWKGQNIAHVFMEVMMKSIIYEREVLKHNKHAVEERRAVDDCAKTSNEQRTISQSCIIGSPRTRSSSESKNEDLIIALVRRASSHLSFYCISVWRRATRPQFVRNLRQIVLNRFYTDNYCSEST